ncbi:O-antigen polymerase [Shewanella chilikensis]|uniref:O-antigen polymerase n=1 Tax=Shewanella chilikensis TaxID=558541 RepID=UPI0030073AF5
MGEFITFKVISIIFSLSFLGMAYMCKRCFGGWLNPGSIFNLFWSLYTFLPLFLAYYAPINPLAVAYIVIFCAFFSGPMFFFDWKKARESNAKKRPPNYYFRKSQFVLGFYTISLLSIFFMLFGMALQGFSVTDMITNPIGTAGRYAGARYASELSLNFFSRAGLLGSYISIILGGLVYGAVRDNNRKVIVLAFLPSLLAMMLQSAKGLFFLSVFLFLAGILICRIYRGEFYLFNRAAIKKGVQAIIVVLPILIMSFLARGMSNASSEEIIDKIQLYLTSYSSGHLYAFSDWFSYRYFDYSLLGYSDVSAPPGYYTLMSLFNSMGYYVDLPMGVYDDYFDYEGRIKSNIYTIFRGGILDFSLLGFLLYGFFVGIAVNFFFYRLLYSRFNPAYIVFFILYVALAYQSYLISTLMWKTIPFVGLLSFLIVFVLAKIRFFRRV